MSTSPLAAAHRAAGAAVVEEMGRELAADYGDPAAEARFVHGAAALFDQSYRGVLDLAGANAVEVLHGVFSSHVRDLSAATGQASCLLDARGRLAGAFHLFKLAEGGLRLVFGEPLRAAFVKALSKYCLLSDIELVERTAALGILSLQGPQAAAVLSAAAPGAALPGAPRGTGVLRLAGAEVVAVRGGETPEGGFELWVPGPALVGVWEALARGVRAAGGGPAGWRAQEVLRIEAGIARHGKEYDDESFPNEVGWEGALTYDKCYVGQEIVARMRTYGQVHRKLKGLRLPEAALPAPGAVVRVEGQEAGRVTSAGFSTRLGCALALALVKRRFWDAGRAAVDGVEGEAEVVELPFVKAGPRL